MDGAESHESCGVPLQMNDMMLYTYPQQDGKYRLKNTLSLSGMKVRLLTPGSPEGNTSHGGSQPPRSADGVSSAQVSKPVLDQVLNCLRIEVSDVTITLSARWASPKLLLFSSLAL